MLIFAHDAYCFLADLDKRSRLTSPPSLEWSHFGRTWRSELVVLRVIPATLLIGPSLPCRNCERTRHLPRLMP